MRDGTIGEDDRHWWLLQWCSLMIMNGEELMVVWRCLSEEVEFGLLSLSFLRLKVVIFFNFWNCLILFEFLKFSIFLDFLILFEFFDIFYFFWFFFNFLSFLNFVNLKNCLSSGIFLNFLDFLFFWISADYWVSGSFTFLFFNNFLNFLSF